MANNDKISRREALKISLSVLPIAAGSAALLSACGDSAIDCTDTSGLAEAELATRTNLEYVEASTNPQQNCLNCRFYTGNDSACGTCTLVKGPINPAGNCKSWVAKA